MRLKLFRALLLTSLAAAAFAISARAQVDGDGERWDRDSARAAVASIDWSDTRDELLGLTLSAGPNEVIGLLSYTRQRPDWPAPVRDAAIHGYVQSLRDLPGAAVPPEVMVWLERYEPLTIVAHEDHATGEVPLFPVRSAVFGVENTWRRREAGREGVALLRAHPRALADAWLLDPHPAVRAGYLDALDEAAEDRLDQLARHGIKRMLREPELAPLAANAALATGRTAELGEVLSAVPGPYAAPLLTRAGAELDRVDRLQLLERLLEEAEPGTAAVAMAQLYPTLAGLPSMEVPAGVLLLERLGDPALGSAAALTLARAAPQATLATLRELRDEGEGLAAERARLALETRALLTGGGNGAALP
jgi:hypothetical protein